MPISKGPPLALSIFPQPCPQPRHLALCDTRWGETFSLDEWFEKQYCQMPTVLRDGPLGKLLGGWGIFETQEYFFVIKFLVSIFFRP